MSTYRAAPVCLLPALVSLLPRRLAYPNGAFFFPRPDRPSRPAATARSSHRPVNPRLPGVPPVCLVASCFSGSGFLTTPRRRYLEIAAELPDRLQQFGIGRFPQPTPVQVGAHLTHSGHQLPRPHLGDE